MSRANFINRAFMRYLINMVDRKFPQTPVMSTADLEKKISSESEKLLLIDCRTKKEFDVSRISGAVWCTFDGKDSELEDVMRKNLKGAGIVDSNLVYIEALIRFDFEHCGLLRRRL